MDDLSIIPECYVDTNLIETLVPTTKGYNHQKGCNTVTRVMIERFADRFALGIIDRDKKEVKYLEDFNIICSEDSLILHKHKDRPHYIIQITPAIELFIIKNTLSCNLELGEFDLPSNLTLLKKESKKSTSKKDQRFKKLFRSLIANESPEIMKLKNWITYLKDKNYSVNLNELRNL